MGLIQFGSLVNAISGKLSGDVLMSGKAGNIIRKKASPMQPVSNYSAVVRSRFTSIAQLWSTLAGSVINSWNAAAKDVKLKGKFGVSYSPSGMQLFATLNNNLAALGVVPITAVPDKASVPTMTSASLTGAHGTPALSLTYAPAVPATVGFVLEATNGLRASVQPKASDFRQIGKILTANSSPYDILTLYTAKFGAIPAAGKVVYVRMRPVHLTYGWGGQPFSCSATIGA